MSQINVDNIKGRTGGAIGAPSGAVVTGVTTATGLDINGNADISGALTVGGNVSVGGTLTYDDVTNVDSVGVITARSTIDAQGNVSIADKIIHTGDTNTAIRFPAADTFTVETGGSEALRVNSDQKLLVGSTSSRDNFFDSSHSSNIQVEGNTTTKSSLAVIRNDNGSDGSRIFFAKSRGTGDTIVQDDDRLGAIEFQGNDGGGFVAAAHIASFVDGTPGSNDMPARLVFSTTADGASSATERLRITSGGASIFKGGLVEKFENAGTTLGSQPNNPLSDGNVILFTGNESGNKTINFTGVHSVLSSGETVSFTVIISPNGSGVINVVQVDGQPITVKWSGGAAPSAGASGQDIYTFQILKTGTGASNYTVFGVATNFA